MLDAERENQASPVLHKYRIQPLGGDSYDVDLDQPRASVREVKKCIARKIGVEVYRQELYQVLMPDGDKGAVREDDAESRALGLDEEVVAGTTLTLSVRDLVQWDEEWKGSNIVLSENGTCATTGISGFDGQCVRGKEALQMESGVHAFECVYSRLSPFSQSNDDNACMGSCHMVLLPSLQSCTGSNYFPLTPLAGRHGESLGPQDELF
jgi:hypothetical protein